MSNIAISASDQVSTLPALVDRAASTLAGARTAAEVLDARDMAAAAYDAAKSAARFAKAKNAHDELLSKVHRAQADALEIEAAAKRRLADEYDAAQERGEVAATGDTLRQGSGVPEQNAGKATAADLGLSRKDIHEARIIRDAEEADPGIVKRTIEDAISRKEEPTKAIIRRATLRTIREEAPSASPPPRGNAAVHQYLKDALIHLAVLPPPHRALEIVRGTDTTIVIEERLATAAAWLAEFAQLWSEAHADAE